MASRYDTNRFIAGYDDTVSSNPMYYYLWSEENLSQMQQAIMRYLENVHPSGRSIKVTYDVIGAVMSKVSSMRRSNLGGGQARYLIPSIPAARDDLTDIVDQTINIIVTYIRNEYEMAAQNQKLSKWTTIRGEQNPHGLLSHPPLKLARRRPDSFQFNMRY